MAKHQRSVSTAHLARRWHRAPRRWGHPLHSVCSYFAMFPPQVPRVFIEWLTRPGDVVYDPFSGRGTTVLEACRLGRLGFGADANPLAAVLTAAKADPPTAEEAHERLEALRRACRTYDATSAPEDIQMLYHPSVLGQLLWLRDELEIGDRTDRLLLAVLLGILHGNYKPGAPARGLSISMPNTFSMSPGYVRRYIREHGLTPPAVDVLDLVARKLERLELPTDDRARGAGWIHDAREAVPESVATEGAKLVFTSPPYLNVINYGKYNWIRLWMLRQGPRSVDRKLLATSSLERYVQFMSDVVSAQAAALRPDGFLCLMIGDVRRRGSETPINLAKEVRKAVEGGDLHHVATINDRLPTSHKVSRIWKEQSGKATKTDRIVILSKTKLLPADLPALPRLSWGQPSWMSAHA